VLRLIGPRLTTAFAFLSQASTTMAKTVLVLLGALAMAGAFMAPRTPMGRGRSMKMAFEYEVGVTAPLGYFVSAPAREPSACRFGQRAKRSREAAGRRGMIPYR
jgi:hypothetical protein